MPETLTSLSDVLALMAPDGTAMQADVPAGWMQGRTTYGGMTSALLLASTLRAFDDLPPLRSMLVNFTAPVGGAPRFAHQVLRRGRNITTITADALGDSDDVLARATFTFGAAIAEAPERDLPAPDALRPDDAPEMFRPEHAFAPPPFIQNFEMRFIDGAPPFSGAKKGEMRVWARLRNPADRAGIVPLVALGDALPPAALITHKGPAVNSSVTWICNILRPEADTTDGWYMLDMALSADRDGYSSQIMRIWDSAGRLVAEGSQSVVIFPRPDAPNYRK